MSIFSAWYKRRYHRHYVHAKKLFVFDLGLLAASIILFSLVLFWSLYDPTVLRNVHLRMTGPTTRIQSGDSVSFTISYNNASAVVLDNAFLTLTIPPGFIPEQLATPRIPLGDILPKKGGEIKLQGRFYGTPGESVRFTAALVYTQKGNNREELQRAALLFTAQTPAITTTISGGPNIIVGGLTPITITITNVSTNPTTGIELPLGLPHAGITIIDPTVHNGFIHENTWNIDPLLPGQQATLQAFITTAAPEKTGTPLQVTFLPAMMIGKSRILQDAATHTFTLVDPHLSFEATFDTALTAKPGDVLPLHLIIKNSEALKNLSLHIPIPDAIVDTKRLALINTGVLENGIFRLDAKTLPTLSFIAPEDVHTFDVLIPIRPSTDGGTDLTLALTPRIRASLKSTGDTAIVEASTKTPIVRIGTTLIATAMLRYYTDEGDQLGRGPLPEETGKETRYGAILTIQNTTSRIADIVFSAILSKHAIWTFKTSVSQGHPITYAPDTSRISWGLEALEPHDTVTLFMEIGFTPTEDELGLPVPLLTDIVVTGTDTFTGKSVLYHKEQPLDTSLPDDMIAREKIRNTP